MDSNVNKTKTISEKKTVLLITQVSVLVDYGIDIKILGNERRNISMMKFIFLSITFLYHAMELYP